MKRKEPPRRQREPAGRREQAPAARKEAANPYSEYLDTLEGAAVAELLVRLLVRASFDDPACVVIDALIYLGQEAGVTASNIAKFIDPSAAMLVKGIEDILHNLVTKTIVTRREGQVENINRNGVKTTYTRTVYYIDYLWAFHLAEERYIRMKATLDQTKEEPVSEYVCSRCGRTFVGEFAVFDLSRDPTTAQLYCKTCNGSVSERIIQKNAEMAQVRSDAAGLLSLFEAFLKHKPKLFVPKKAESVYSSGEFLSAAQYHAFQEQVGIQAFESSVWQMDVEEKVKKLRTAQASAIQVELVAETMEQRKRREVEENKRKRQKNARDPPWLRDAADEPDADAAAPPPEADAPKPAGLKRIGGTAFVGPTRFNPDAYCFYLRDLGGELRHVEKAADDDFVPVSQYLAEAAWPKYAE
ncbi:hypothetical protein DIPPA_08828 [Diplonema papillatum]|nr:hypothetical protein DIPPA_08828 [Diplonema papillatum]